MCAFYFPQNEDDGTRLFWDSFSWWASKHEFYDQIGISTTAVLSLPPDGRKRERIQGSIGLWRKRSRECERVRNPLKRSKNYNAAVCSSTRVYAKQISPSVTVGLKWVCIHNVCDRWLFQNHGELNWYQQLNQHPFQHHGQSLCNNHCNPIMTLMPRCI